MKTNFIVFLLLVLFWTSGFVQSASVALDKRQWSKTDFSKTTIDLDEIMSGGPPKDGIPAIDDPRFVSIKDAANWLGDHEPVIVLEMGNEVRAYPIQILIFHEIVNDEISGIPVSITFCPLCNAAIVFKRTISGKILDFGTTGNLRKSDMVMYDRQTQSWWQQFTGTGIVGYYAGAELEQLPATIVAFNSFSTNFPAGIVLSKRTGYSRPYGHNPYRGYDDIDGKPFLFFDPIDKRLRPMERVLAVMHSGINKIYPLSKLGKKSVVNDVIGRQPVVIMSEYGMLSALDQADIQSSRSIRSAKAYSRYLDGKKLRFIARPDGIFDIETGSRWNIFGQAQQGPLKGKRLESLDSGVHFAFAWLAFKPDSLIFRP